MNCKLQYAFDSLPLWGRARERVLAIASVFADSTDLADSIGPLSPTLSRKRARGHCSQSS